MKSPQEGLEPSVPEGKSGAYHRSVAERVNLDRSDASTEFACRPTASGGTRPWSGGRVAGPGGARAL
ncbi:MAG: hypothetical protein ACR2NM_14460, partial [Bythopirellula sp.]